MKVYECQACGHLVLEDVIIALKKIGIDKCNNPGSCDEPFVDFKLLVEDL
jgi:hypothetical protein